MSLLILILFGLNFILFKNYSLLGEKLKIIDYPDKIRKIHKKKSYSIGGVILTINILIIYIFNFFLEINFFGFASGKEEIAFYFGLISIFTLGLFDDKYDLSANLKFLITILIICAVLFLNSENKLVELRFDFLDLKVSTVKVSFVLTLICYVLFLNAINMFDGINLQLALYSLVGFIYLYMFNNNLIFILLIIFITFFIFWNFTGKVFFGDNGSLSIGFILSYFFIKDYNANNFLYVEEIFIFMALPGFDMLRLFCVRIFNKKSPFKPDKNHFHHILLKTFSEKKTVFTIQIFLIISLIISMIYEKAISIILLMLFYLFFLIYKKSN